MKSNRVELYSTGSHTENLDTPEARVRGIVRVDSRCSSGVDRCHPSNSPITREYFRVDLT